MSGRSIVVVYLLWEHEVRVRFSAPRQRNSPDMSWEPAGREHVRGPGGDEVRVRFSAARPNQKVAFGGFLICEG